MTGLTKEIGEALAVTPWVNDNTIITVNNYGTVTVEAFYRLVGDSLEVKAKVVAGTVSSTLPGSVTLNGYTIALDKHLSGTNLGWCGFGFVTITSGTPSSILSNSDYFVMFTDGSDTDTIFITKTTASSAMTKQNANQNVGNSETFFFNFSVPVS
jgi:hypothetical protein